MKKWIVSVLLCLGLPLFVSPLYAGVEPSPFQPEINQLGAVGNSLQSCLDRVEKVLAVLSDPSLPGHDINGVVNRMDAINGQMTSLDDFISSTISSVMGAEPSPFRTDLIPALQSVKAVSDVIAEDIDLAIAAHPPEPGSELDQALKGVMFAADDLTATVLQGIDEINGGPNVCAPNTMDEVACMGAGCNWIDITEPYYCCCIGGQ